MLKEHGGNLEAIEAHWGPTEKAVTDFSINLNLFAPKPDAKLWGKWLERIGTYPPPTGHSIEARLKDIYGIRQGYVVSTHGAMEALDLVLRLFSGRTVYIPCPCFNEYLHVAESNRCRIIRILQEKAQWQTLDFVSRAETGSVILIGNPGNPTGQLLPKDTLKHAIRTRPDLIWVIDEAFIEFTTGGNSNSLTDSLSELRNCILLRSLTKSWAIPGIRIGFAATSNENWSHKISKHKLTWSLCAVTHAWADHFLKREYYQQLRNGLKNYAELKEELSDAIEQLEGIQVIPSTTNYLLLELYEPNAVAAAQKLWQKGILVRTMSGVPGINENHYLRICVRDKRDNKHFTGTLKTVLHEL
ncbi:MAG: aminotransferase class I/II-fold pyridoxal phosphate-dependent enzyme [Opitutales bacterium]|nr:aminotransferase class I/II-fold pyridoxal phosphate-dependent enzyme [Opitutales bacterium]